MSPEQPVDWQEFYLKPWSRLLGFSGPAALIMVPLALERRAAASLTEEMAAAQYLSASEQQHLRNFSFPKRRLQWLGGRIAAKLAARKLLELGDQVESSLSWPHLQVAAEPSGRPYLQLGNEAPVPGPGIILPDISISHSGPLACALAVDQPARCGVDIQMITESTVRVKERFAASSELEILESLPGVLPLPARLTLLWAAKEAIRKAADTEPLPGFLEMGLTSASRVSDSSDRPGFVFAFRCPPGPRAIHQAWRRESVEVAAIFCTDVALAFTVIA